MYAIKTTPNFYHGTIYAPQEHFLTIYEIDGDVDPAWRNEIERYVTREEAQEVVDSLKSGTYILQHGEAGRPDYEIIDLDDYDMCECLSANGEEINEYVEVPAESIPAEIKEKLSALNVEYHSSEVDYDTYIGYYTHTDDKEYAIMFCPKSTSLQINVDDLGGISWENEAYFIKQD